MRNNVQNRGIIIPQFANLNLYESGYTMSITLPIKSSLIEYIKQAFLQG